MTPLRTTADLSPILDRRPLSAIQLRVILLCALVVLLDGLDTQVIAYLGPALAKEWNLSRAVLGPVFSAGLVGLMAGLLLVGPIADRFGRKNTIVIATALFGLFTFLTSFARGLPDLFVYRVLTGIGLGGAMPNALALTGEYCPKRRRATLVVLMFCGFSVGSILGGGLAAAFITRYGWRAIFIIGGVIPLVLAPALAWRLPESLQFLVLRGNQERVRALVQQIAPERQPSADTQYILPEPSSRSVPVMQLFAQGRALGTMLLWIIFFMNLLDFYFLQNWLPTLFTDSGLTVERAALLTTLISAGGIVAGLLSGPLMDRFGAYPVLAGLYACGVAAVAGMGVAKPASLLLIIAVTFAAGFCVSGGQKSVNALAVMFYPTAARSTGVGWALGIGRIGSIVGPLVGGWLLAAGWPVFRVFQFAAAPMLVASIVAFGMGLRYGRQKHE